MTQMVGTLGARYLYDGDEITGVVASPTGTTLNARFVRGPWADELILAYQGTDTSLTNYNVQDPQGSIIAIADGYGSAMHRLAYDEYGQPRAGNAGRLMYTGQLWLPDFGLYPEREARTDAGRSGVPPEALDRKKNGAAWVTRTPDPRIAKSRERRTQCGPRLHSDGTKGPSRADRKTTPPVRRAGSSRFPPIPRGDRPCGFRRRGPSPRR